jgi:hypothetical protein
MKNASRKSPRSASHGIGQDTSREVVAGERPVERLGDVAVPAEVHELAREFGQGGVAVGRQRGRPSGLEQGVHLTDGLAQALLHAHLQHLLHLLQGGELVVQLHPRAALVLEEAHP